MLNTQSSETKYLVAFGDTHGGHKAALCNPETQWEEQDAEGLFFWDSPTLTPVQEWLWERYDYCRQEALRFIGGNPFSVIHLGDITWGVKYPDNLVSMREDIQRVIAYYNMLPWLAEEQLEHVRLIQGTSSHEFGNGASSIETARNIRLGFPHLDVTAPAHVLISYGGIRFDCAHHGAGPGIRAWTSGNVVRHSTRSAMIKNYMSLGKVPPDVMLRAHFHTYIKETVIVGKFETKAYILPAFCGLTSYARQRTQSVPSLSCGLVVFAIRNGRLVDTLPLVSEIDLRTEEDWDAK